jgi:hypothetical protein
VLLALDDAFLPATLTAPPMTDDEFAEFCGEHPDLWFEVTAEGELLVAPPAFTLTGARNADITCQVHGDFAKHIGRAAYWLHPEADRE